MINYKRYEGESDDELIYRVCSDKEKIGTWEEVGILLNDLLSKDYSESAYRKKFQSFNKMLQANQSKFVNEEAQLEEITQKIEDLQKERYKLQATKLELVREKRQDSRFELFYENLKKAITTIAPPEFKFIPNDNQELEYVLAFADIHYGATFESENNVYSREECKKRFDRLLNSTVDYIEKNNITYIKVLNGGDTLQGILRLSDLQINDTDVVMCVVEASKLIANFLSTLSKYTQIDYYHVCAANHTQTRNLGSKASALAGEDLEKIIANYINDMLSDNDMIKVIFDTSKEYIDFNIYDFECTLEHGHRIRNVQNFLRDKSALRRKIYSYGFVGHTHSSREIIVGEERNNNSEILVIPSFIGSDPYADSLNVGSKAMAKIYSFDPKYGHIGSENIILN